MHKKAVRLQADGDRTQSGLLFAGKGDYGTGNVAGPVGVGTDHQIIIAVQTPVAVGKEIIVVAALFVHLADQFTRLIACDALDTADTLNASRYIRSLFAGRQPIMLYGKRR